MEWSSGHLPRHSSAFPSPILGIFVFGFLSFQIRNAAKAYSKCGVLESAIGQNLGGARGFDFSNTPVSENENLNLAFQLLVGRAEQVFFYSLDVAVVAATPSHCSHSQSMGGCGRTGNVWECHLNLSPEMSVHLPLGVSK
jgi:hypothetical protein